MSDQNTPAEKPAGLHDRIAAALYERERPPRDPHWADAYPADREVFEAMADVVLAVLPEPADMAAIEAAAFKAAANYVRGHSADERYGKASISTALCAVSDELYRWADGAQQPETQAGLKRAHVALAAQAGRDQAAVARVRAYLASQTDALPSGYPVAVPAADVLAALDGQPAAVPKPGKEA